MSEERLREVLGVLRLDGEPVDKPLMEALIVPHYVQDWVEEQTRDVPVEEFIRLPAYVALQLAMREKLNKRADEPSDFAPSPSQHNQRDVSLCLAAMKRQYEIDRITKRVPLTNSAIILVAQLTFAACAAASLVVEAEMKGSDPSLALGLHDQLEQMIAELLPGMT